MLFFGLGNYPEEYKNNRHNVGHMFIDFLAKRLGINLKAEKKIAAEIGKKGEIYLAKNMNFMNISGESVSKVINYYKLTPEELYIVYDELDIPLGKFKIQKGVFSKLHNGVRSVIKALKTSEINFIRIGIDNRKEPIPGEKYVLQDFKKEERQRINQVFEKIYERIKDLLLAVLISLFLPQSQVNAQSFIPPTEIVKNFNLNPIHFLAISIVYLTILHFALKVKKDVEIYGLTLLVIFCFAIGFFFKNYAIGLIFLVIFSFMYI